MFQIYVTKATKASNRQWICIKTAFSKQIISLQQRCIYNQHLLNQHQNLKYILFPNLCYDGNQIIEPMNLHKKSILKVNYLPSVKLSMNNSYKLYIIKIYFWNEKKKKKKKMLQNKAKLRLPWQPNPQTASGFT